MVLDDNLYGYINTSGEYIIKPQYPLARTFSDGVACINEGGNRDNGFVQGVLGGKYYFIDVTNKKQFDGFFSTSPMSFFNKVAIVINDNETKELLNAEGKIVASGFTVLGECENELIPAVIEKEKKVGYVNTKGQWQIELPYKYFISPFSEQLASFTDSDTKLNGFFDTNGEIVIPAKFESTGNFSDGLARVKTGTSYFFIDSKGNKPFDQKFENAGNFSNGLCAVQKNGNWGFINKKGELAIDYKDVLGVRACSEERIAFKDKNGKIGYMNTTGKVVIEPQFDNGLSFKNGFAVIEQNGKMGFIDETGKTVIEPKYKRAGNFVNPNKSNKIIKVN